MVLPTDGFCCQVSPINIHNNVTINNQCQHFTRVYFNKTLGEDQVLCLEWYTVLWYSVSMFLYAPTNPFASVNVAKFVVWMLYCFVINRPPSLRSKIWINFISQVRPRAHHTQCWCMLLELMAICISFRLERRVCKTVLRVKGFTNLYKTFEMAQLLHHLIWKK